MERVLLGCAAGEIQSQRGSCSRCQLFFLSESCDVFLRGDPGADPVEVRALAAELRSIKRYMIVYVDKITGAEKDGIGESVLTPGGGLFADGVGAPRAGACQVRLDGSFFATHPPNTSPCHARARTVLQRNTPGQC